MFAGYALIAHVLPATTAWAAAHGWHGWIAWLGWVAGSLTGLHMWLHRLSRPAAWGVHVSAVTAVYMAVSASIPWSAATLAVVSAAYLWVLAHLTGQHIWRAQRPR